ncbi:hypothetical protein KIPB_012235, partial [Kipferlia bialata]
DRASRRLLAVSGTSIFLLIVPFSYRVIEARLGHVTPGWFIAYHSFGNGWNGAANVAISWWRMDVMGELKQMWGRKKAMRQQRKRLAEEVSQREREWREMKREESIESQVLAVPEPLGDRRELSLINMMMQPAHGLCDDDLCFSSSLDLDEGDAGSEPPLTLHWGGQGGSVPDDCISSSDDGGGSSGSEGDSVPHSPHLYPTSICPREVTLLVQGEDTPCTHEEEGWEERMEGDALPSIGTEGDEEAVAVEGEGEGEGEGVQSVRDTPALQGEWDI